MQLPQVIAMASAPPATACTFFRMRSIASVQLRWFQHYRSVCLHGYKLFRLQSERNRSFWRGDHELSRHQFQRHGPGRHQYRKQLRHQHKRRWYQRDRNAQNCYGSSNTGNGLVASSLAMNSFGGAAGNGIGLSTSVATNCFGSNTGAGTGLQVSRGIAADHNYFGKTGPLIFP